MRQYSSGFGSEGHNLLLNSVALTVPYRLNLNYSQNVCMRGRKIEVIKSINNFKKRVKSIKSIPKSINKRIRVIKSTGL